MEQDIIAVSVLKRGIRLKLPETLPEPSIPRYQKIDFRDRQRSGPGSDLLLLRTGIRIGEAWPEIE